MASTKEKMQRARQLIGAKRYNDARIILRTIDHPKAWEWLDKLDKIAPAKSRLSKKSKTKTSWKMRLIQIVAGLFLFMCLCSFIAVLIGGDASKTIIPTSAVLAISTTEPTVDSTGTEALETLMVATDSLAFQTATPQTQFDLLPSSTPLPVATSVSAQVTSIATIDNQAALAPIFASATAAMAQVQSIRPTVRPSATRSIPTSIPTARRVAMTMYINDGGVRARACPRTDCEIITTLSRGDTISVFGTTDGMNLSGSSLWYEMDYNGQIVFVYSAFVQQYEPSDPIVRPVVSGGTFGQTSSTGGSGVQSNTVPPANCAEAVAMGLTAQQAAQWSYLDRDNDGVACYGD